MRRSPQPRAHRAAAALEGAAAGNRAVERTRSAVRPARWGDTGESYRVERGPEMTAYSDIASISVLVGAIGMSGNCDVALSRDHARDSCPQVDASVRVRVLFRGAGAQHVRPPGLAAGSRAKQPRQPQVSAALRSAYRCDRPGGAVDQAWTLMPSTASRMAARNRSSPSARHASSAGSFTSGGSRNGMMRAPSVWIRRAVASCPAASASKTV